MAATACSIPAPPIGVRFQNGLGPCGIRFSSSSPPAWALHGICFVRLLSGTARGKRRREETASIRCSAANKPSSSSSEIRSSGILVKGMGYFFAIAFDTFTGPFTDLPQQLSSTAKIRSEVLSPFRSVRMFFYLAFIASGGLGGLIAITQLIGALSNSSRAAEVPEIFEGLGVDVGAVLIFAFLYSRESNAKNAQVARLSREESLSNLKLRVDEKRVIPVSSLRGFARLVILAGPASFISESFNRSLSFTEALLDRGVLVVHFVTDGNTPVLDFEKDEEDMSVIQRRKRLWQLTPVYTSEWSKWLDEQKEMAKVASDAPVYLSLRMDGRVRGSGVGYPPWNAFVAQLPPVKGIWTGLLDGMDGRVL